MVETVNNNKSPERQSEVSSELPTISTSVINPDFVTVSNRRAKLKRTLRKFQLKENRLENRSLFIASGITNAFLLITAIGFIILWLIQVEKNSKMKMCTSRECLLSASRLMNSIDKGFDACDDFYQFACGNWQLQNPASMKREHTSLFKETKSSLLKSALDLLNDKIYQKETLTVQLAKELYQECMKTELIEQLGLYHLKELLFKLGLPKEPPNANTTENFNLTDMVSRLQYHLPLTDAIVTVGMTVHPDDQTKRMVLLAMPKKNRIYKVESFVGLYPESSMKKRKKRSVLEYVTDELKYRTMVMEIFENEKVHGPKLDETTLRTAAFQTLIIESDLHAAVPKKPGECKVLTIAELQKETDKNAKGMNSMKINWLLFFQTLLKDVKGLTVTPKYQIVVERIEHFKKMTNIIAKQKSENIQRFIWWKVVDFFIPYTMRATRELRYVNDGDYFYQDNVLRPLECMKTVEEVVPLAVIYKFLNHPQMNTTRRKIEEMLHDIKDSLASSIEDADWLIGNIIMGALEKLDNMKHIIGYPEEYLQEAYMESLYDKNLIVRGNLIESILNLYTFASQQALNKLLVRLSLKEVVSSAVSALDVNAYNILTSNTIVILPGLLQPPFYGLGIEALNYGAIGAIIGHEITHGFDDEGRKYGKNGKLSEWWSVNLTTEFDKKKCFIKQYNKYLVYDKYVRPKNAERETIADNGGIRHAYQAYKRYKKQNGDEPRLPGLEEYSNEQLFFLSYAHMMCSNYTRELITKMVKEDHIPEKFRVIGSLSNMKEFSDVWDCSSKKFMNRDEKCVLW